MARKAKIMMEVEISEPLSWNEVADIYDERFGGTARILRMQTVFDRVKKLEGIYLHPKEGTLHRILKSNEKSETGDQNGIRKEA